MALEYTVFVILLAFVIVSFIRHSRMRKQQPPGPLGLPFVFNLMFQVLHIFFSRLLPKFSQTKYFREMKQKYGDIWSLDMGFRRIVVLASINSITEALSDNAKLFSGKPIQENFRVLSEDEGIIYVSGELAFSNRQLAIRALRELGMGKPILHGKICYEVDELLENIEKNISKPISSPNHFTIATANVIGQLTFNERNAYDDPVILSFIESLKYMLHSNKAQDIMQLFSKSLSKEYVRKLFPIVDKFIKSSTECMRIMTIKCKSRMKIEGEYSKPACVFDYFWRYRYQNQPEVCPEEKIRIISHSMFDIILGGSDTAANMLSFASLILGQYQDIQNELKKEIRSLVDDYKAINMDMRKDCPKLLSFIDEVHRYCNLAIVFPRRTMETCRFRGYEIESNDLVICDLFNTHRDPAIFENPDEFDPYRFMDESRTKYVPNKCLIPFGLGKRACLGESIAAVEMFLFLSKIIHRFNISLSKETKNNFCEILEGSFGFIHAPLDHEIIFELSHY